MLGKFDSYRDSALHFLCSSEWGNDSFGDVSTYGVYIWRISLSRDDVFGCFDQGNSEFDSIIEDWEHWKEYEITHTTNDLLKSLVGHFMVSENDRGQVTVKEYTLESELIRQFTNMQAHYIKFDAALEED